MRANRAFCLAAALALASAAHAGQVYGNIVKDGKGVGNAKFEIQCGSADPVSGTTAADGAYRVNVPQQGQCTLTLSGHEGKPKAAVFSSPNPALYNLEVVKGADGKAELKRR